ncbi:FAD-dependent oxidoreductase [Actinomadura kijaniata]|uniref:2-polyprenyl-6-methoxyphenol hydroxylase-like FAD-dependent oxidoreductase n=1 Tax=Actinomadura namibiensis TaxID=182080 RepID=A0A7W3LWX1_ACTNM|nr:FAD-dependent oxidoreductase [Actinomadura namibiensis]MBA8955710.1 2-polyprenyl-6-methoxyphenol hydroxylase-like FAD-dependent oxidoreductase [Actinomadura namibiensis]
MTEATMTTTCLIAGGGPAGAVLGLLLARAGIEVTVLEKHGDFLRDFRGDTIHPSTLDALDELGLGDRFERLDHRKLAKLSLVTDEGEMTISALSTLRGPHPYIAMVPQWDFLNMITEEAARYPTFRLLMNAEATGLLREGDRVTGVRYRDADGAEHRIRAHLTVAADGRHSILRRAAGLRSRESGVPMDVAWFRLPRHAGDREDAFLRVSRGRMAAVINRTTYWQIAYLVPKGRYAEVEAAGVESFRRSVAELLPFLADRVGTIDMADVRVLDVRVDRLLRWWRPGLLCIGDAAHAMSPVGGVGINLAIQDAIATANLLDGPLRRAAVTERDLAAVERRRTPPTRIVQGFQLGIQRAAIAPIMRGAVPLPIRLLNRLRGVGPLPRVTARMVGYGPRPEHVRTPQRTTLAPEPLTRA